MSFRHSNTSQGSDEFHKDIEADCKRFNSSNITILLIKIKLCVHFRQFRC